MNQLMKTLYSYLGTKQQEEEARACQASKEAIRAAEQHLTYDEFEALWNAITDIESAGELDSFILGYRLGVQLTLEGLRPVSLD